MNVTLTPDLEQIVNQCLASGLYKSAGEVIGEALRLLQEQDHLLESQLEELRGKIAIGLSQLRNGEGVSGEQVFEELRQMSELRRQ